jgi:hypothetical protein
MELSPQERQEKFNRDADDILKDNKKFLVGYNEREKQKEKQEEERHRNKTEFLAQEALRIYNEGQQADEQMAIKHKIEREKILAQRKEHLAAKQIADMKDREKTAKMQVKKRKDKKAADEKEVADKEAARVLSRMKRSKGYLEQEMADRARARQTANARENTGEYFTRMAVQKYQRTSPGMQNSIRAKCCGQCGKMIYQ